MLYYAAYFLLAALTPEQERGDGLRAVLMILSGWAMFAYWRPFARTVFEYGEERERHPYSIFVFLIALGTNMNQCWVLLWRLAGRPQFLVSNAIFDTWVVHAIAAFFVAVTVPNLFGRGVPPGDKIRLGAVWFLMFVFVAYAVLLQPDLQPVAELMRPLLEFSIGDWLRSRLG